MTDLANLLLNLGAQVKSIFSKVIKISSSQEDHPADFLVRIWNIGVPEKVQILGWLIALNTLNTLDKIQKRMSNLFWHLHFYSGACKERGVRKM